MEGVTTEEHLTNNDTTIIDEEDDVAPQLGMKFETLDEVWVFWNFYGGTKGFGVRKGNEVTSGIDGVITSKTLLCNCEGQRGKDKRDHLTKDPRAHTRTGCKACLKLKFDRSIQKYKVVGFVSEHNHSLVKPDARYLIRSQRKVSQVASIDIHLADSSGIRPRAAYDLHCKQAGGVSAIGYTEVDHNNCLRDQRKEALKCGSATAVTRYFARREFENPSFKHFEDTNEEGEISNIVWTDGEMIAAYARFGDIVSFDTTFGTNKEKWACGVFVGFNHFREIVIFGGALMCDQTKPSFEWVFTKFEEAHGGKRPITIFTDQDFAMGGALKNVWPSTRHLLCVWHIGHNCAKNLACYNKNGMNVIGEFSALMFRYEEENDFNDEWNKLKVQLGEENTWLKFIYESKRKWAYCFVRDAYTLGIRSTQAGESINSNLKAYLNVKLNIYRFFENFDTVLDKNRQKQVRADFNMTIKLPRIKLHFPILVDAGKVYTPKVFELFQAEFEKVGLAKKEGLEGNVFTIGMCDVGGITQCKSRQVAWNGDDQTVSCSCKKFEREGILCCHALKVLDILDIKAIPLRYILKRWTREANDDQVVNIEGRTVTEDAQLAVRNCKAKLMRIYVSLCDKGAESEIKSNFLEKTLFEAQKRYEEEFENLERNTSEGTPNFELHLKKKNGVDNRSRRNRPLIEKLPRKKKGRIQNEDSMQGASQESYGNLEKKHNLTIIQD